MRISWLILPALLAASSAFGAGIGFVERIIPVLSETGRELRATLRVPAGLSRGERVPVFLVFGGFESAGRVLDLLHPAVPVALASFDYPYAASRELRFPSSLLELPVAKRLYPETVSGIHALVGALSRQPEIDPGRIAAIGATFGAPFVLAAAAEDRRIRRIVLVHAFGLVPETAEHVLMKTWTRQFGILARPMAWSLTRALWAYLNPGAPEDAARKLDSGRKVLLISASADTFVPAVSSDSLWKAIRESGAVAQRLEMPGDHLLPGADAQIAEILSRISYWARDWLAPAKAARSRERQ